MSCKGSDYRQHNRTLGRTTKGNSRSPVVNEEDEFLADGKKVRKTLQLRAQLANYMHISDNWLNLNEQRTIKKAQ